VHYAAGMAAMSLERYEPAIEQFRLCLERRRKPSFFPLLKVATTAAPVQALGLAYAQAKRYGEAETVFRQALEQEPADKAARYNLARALWAQEKAVPALETLHALIANHADYRDAWLLGGQIALSQPEFLEFAADWTGEAVKHLPQDQDLAAQRAEVLMLRGEMSEALTHWRAAASKEHPARTAALILCELCVDELGEHALNGSSNAVNGEFLRWYQKLAAANAQAPLLKVNQGLSRLRSVLPAATRALEAAMQEAGS
jgi:tetratricopeptide (TPR) repeat protein